MPRSFSMDLTSIFPEGSSVMYPNHRRPINFNQLQILTLPHLNHPAHRPHPSREKEDGTSCETSHPAAPRQWPAARRPGFARASAWARSACRTLCRCSAETPEAAWTPPERSAHPVPPWEGPALPPVSAGFLWGNYKIIIKKYGNKNY